MFLQRVQLAVATTVVATALHAQAPFALDTTFRTEIIEQYVNSIIALPDGKVIASGLMRFPDEPWTTKHLVRLLPDGAQDPTFTGFTGGGKLTPWNNHFYVSVGQTLRRLLPSCLLDTSFIEPNLDPYFSSLQGGDYHVYPDGRVLISGKHEIEYPVGGYDGLYNLIWFTNTGYLDTTRVHRQGNGTVWFFKELPDGGFICHCSCSQFDGVAVDKIFKTDADGVPDTTFQTDVDAGWAFTYLPLPDGRIYTGGFFRRSDNPLDTLRLVRFMPDGSLDPTFNAPVFTLGELEDPYGPDVYSITPYMDGKLFVTGTFQFANGEPRNGICVVDSTGALMEEFDGCSLGTVEVAGVTTASISGIAPYGADHWLIWGQYVGYHEPGLGDLQQRYVTRLHRGDITTSAPRLSLQPQVLLYPNPSSGTVTLQLDQLPQNPTAIVRDALGREVLRKRVSDHYTTLAIECSGVYFLELRDASVGIANVRFVVE